VGDADRGDPRTARASRPVHSPVAVAHANSVAAGEDTPVLHHPIALSAFARVLIRHKVRRLASRVRAADLTCEDLEQELTLQLLRGLSRFDPDRGHPHAFVTIVLDAAEAMFVRERTIGKRRSGPHRSLHGLEQPAVQYGPDEQDDLRLDVAALIQRLPTELRTLAERLSVDSIAQVARDLGIPRSSLQRRIERLRRRAEDAGLHDYLDADGRPDMDRPPVDPCDSITDHGL